MSNQLNITDSEQFVKRLARAGLQDVTEQSRTTSPGARQSVWAAKVLSLSSYNVYNVALVEINQPGATPTEIGTQMQAYNLAESFTAAGSLAIGTYIVISRVADKNIFYAPV